MMVLVIGIAGDMSSGKGIAARYLKERHGFEDINISDFLRAEAREEEIEPTRDNLHKLFIRFDKKEKYYFLKKVKAQIDSEGLTRVVISGVRQDLDYYKGHYDNFYLIFITAPREIRFKRMKARGRETDPETFEEFKEQEKRELSNFDFEALKKKADFIIDNSKDLKYLYAQLDKIVLKTTGP